ncbi:hypothetical protein BH23GEM5_BH23GEM5_01370 [soil metagenome]
MRRGERRVGVGVIGSVLVHGVVIALAWLSSSAAPTPAAPMRVYAVDIVSPPPNVAGELPETMPTPGDPAPQPEVAAPEPEPVAPPAPPAAAPEPAPAKTPAPPAKSAAPTPPAPAPAVNKPAPAPPARPTPPAAAAVRPASGSTGTARPVPGPNPVASSAGGAGLNVRTQGATFVDQAYLVNIVYRVKRYFRRPDTARTDRAEVCFRIEREGTASDIRIAGASGSAAFKLAVMEAVEQAGVNREFGRLPAAYTADFLPVCLEIQPDQ